MKNAPLFSVVIPVLNEEQNLRLLYDEITAFMVSRRSSFEILFVDDGSSDGTASVLKTLSNDPLVSVFTFAGPRGKSAALAKGFRHARGQYIVTMDGDLQDQPKEIEKLWQVMERTGADLVSGWKKVRHDPWHKIVSSRLFNALVRWVTGVPLHDFNCGLKLYRATVVREIPLYGELYRFIPALASWKGFRVAEEPVEHRARRYGKSKFGAGRVFGMTVDLLTVAFLMRYEGKPSHLFSGAGFLFLLAGGGINFHLFVTKLLGGTIAPHYPYMILGITLLLVGIQFVFFGLLSEMLLYSFRCREKIPGEVFPPSDGNA